MTQTEASYLRVPDEVPPPRCPVTGFTQHHFPEFRQLLVAWDA